MRAPDDGADSDAEYEDPRSHALAHIRRESLDVFNRLHSVAEDVQFVRTVAAAYPDLPILRACLAPLLQAARSRGSKSEHTLGVVFLSHFSVLGLRVSVTATEKRAKGPARPLIRSCADPVA